mgnify:CR=1 FL=1
MKKKKINIMEIRRNILRKGKLINREKGTNKKTDRKIKSSNSILKKDD